MALPLNLNIKVVHLHIKYFPISCLLKTTPPSIQRVPETFHGGKEAGAWSYSSTPSNVFKAWYLVKRRDTFTFTKPRDNSFIICFA
jgi:hypothetical protein